MLRNPIPPVAKKPPARKKRSRSTNPKKGTHWFRRVLLWGALAVFAIVGTVCVTYAIWASTFDMEAVKEMPSRSTVYDMDGTLTR